MKTQLILSLCTLLVACSSGQPQGNTGKYKPVVNPHPQYFLAVHKSPTMSLSQLKVVTRYVAYNQQCNIVTNRLEGARASRSIDLTYISKGGQQKGLRIPFDHYLPGFCQWYGHSISVSFKGDDGHYHLATNINIKSTLPKPSKVNKNITIQLVCNHNDCFHHHDRVLSYYSIPFYQSIDLSITNNK